MRIRRSGVSIRFDEASESESGFAAVPATPIRVSIGLIKNTEYKQTFRKKFRSRSRVICATPVGKGAGPGGSERSFVACAEVIGNCDRATEGEHPEVVPLGGSLKSLAFMRECPKARSD